VPFDSAEVPPEQTNALAVRQLQDRGIISPGDLVVLTKGDYVNAQGGTNTMKIVGVSDDIR
jgi:pyruvate kinase